LKYCKKNGLVILGSPYHKSKANLGLWSLRTRLLRN